MPKSYTPEDIAHFDRMGTNYVIGLTQNVSMALMYATAWQREVFVSAKRKNILRGIMNRLDFVLKESREFVPPHQRELMAKEVLDEEVLSQVVSVSTMMMAMPKHTRDQIEKYTEALYNVYKLN